MHGQAGMVDSTLIPSNLQRSLVGVLPHFFGIVALLLLCTMFLWDLFILKGNAHFANYSVAGSILGAGAGYITPLTGYILFHGKPVFEEKSTYVEGILAFIFATIFIVKMLVILWDGMSNLDYTHDLFALGFFEGLAIGLVYVFFGVFLSKMHKGMYRILSSYTALPAGVIFLLGILHGTLTQL